MDIGQALKNLRDGAAMTRSGWEGPSQYLRMKVPDKDSPLATPYLYTTTTSGDQLPWAISQADLLFDDWQLVRH